MPVTNLLSRFDNQATARAIAVGRIALGATFLFFPGRALAIWPGPVTGSTARARAVDALLARSVGGRDLAIGIGTLVAMHHGAPMRGWLEAGVLADATDTTAVVMAFRHLPKGRGLAMLALAGGAALMGRRLASSLD